MARESSPTRTSSTLVVVASARRALADALICRLDDDRRLEVLREPIDDSTRLFRTIRDRRPGMLLIDDPFIDSMSASSLRRIRALSPRLRMLLISDRICPEHVHKIVANGFHGILLADVAEATCTKAVISVLRGELWLTRTMHGQALEYSRAALAARPAPNADENLTRREQQTVVQLCRGYTNKQIAIELGIREDTVKKHLRSVFRKLQLTSRAQLIARLRDTKLMSLG